MKVHQVFYAASSTQSLTLNSHLTHPTRQFVEPQRKITSKLGTYETMTAPIIIKLYTVKYICKQRVKLGKQVGFY